ncbi:hypothetical protein, partial [Burkholderia multivorans]|uniref:hypothetical protein n=1 Tax=Burkholderia multivorans TaxID=87883 RepID=UPI001C65D42F
MTKSRGVLLILVVAAALWAITLAAPVCQVASVIAQRAAATTRMRRTPRDFVIVDLPRPWRHP